MPRIITNVQTLLKSLKNDTKRGAGSNFLKIEENRPVLIQVIHGEFGPEKNFYLAVGTHFLNGKPVLCNQYTYDQDCYVCNQINETKREIIVLKHEHEELVRAGKRAESATLSMQIKAIEESLEKLNITKRWVMNVLVDGESDPRVFQAPWTVFKPIKEAVESQLERHGLYILNDDKNYPFEVKRTGKGINTEYTVNLQVHPYPLVGQDGKPDGDGIDNLIKRCADLDKDFGPVADDVAKVSWDLFVDGPGEEKKEEAPQRSKPTLPPTMSRRSTPAIEQKAAAAQDDIPMGESTEQPYTPDTTPTEKPVDRAKASSMISRLRNK